MHIPPCRLFFWGEYFTDVFAIVVKLICIEGVKNQRLLKIIFEEYLKKPHILPIAVAQHLIFLHVHCVNASRGNLFLHKVGIAVLILHIRKEESLVECVKLPRDGAVINGRSKYHRIGITQFFQHVIQIIANSAFPIACTILALASKTTATAGVFQAVKVDPFCQHIRIGFFAPSSTLSSKVAVFLFLRGLPLIA